MSSVAESIKTSNAKRAWEKIKGVCSRKSTIPNCIDNVQGETNIAKMFRSKYDKLFSSASTSVSKLEQIRSRIDENIDSCCNHQKCYCDHDINVQDIKTVVRQLKYGKHDGRHRLYSDHFIHGCHRLHVLLAMLLNSMITHNVIPQSLNEAELIPIPKNKNKLLNDGKNYRAIAMSCIIGKMLDLCILAKHRHKLETTELQFGFKHDHSATQCSFAVKEVIQYYKNKNSSVHVMLLDASQAFDRVNYGVLFETLLKRGLCAVISRLLLNIYTHQSMYVKWSEVISKPFTPVNGVKQGGILSPILLTFMGAFRYADDIILLAPSKSSLTSMLQIAKKYANTHDILFNAAKSKYLMFGKTNDCQDQHIIMDNIQIKCTSWEIHLGHDLDSQNSDKYISNAISNLFVSFNSIMYNFHSARADLKYFLFKTYCMSVYGSQLWNYDSKYIAKFYVAWRKCCRRLLGLPYKTHSNLVHLICNDVDIDVQLHRRLLKFINSCVNSKNKKLCCTLALQGSGSNVSDSINFLASTYKFDKYNMPSVIKCNIYGVHTAINIQNASVIKDFIAMREDIDIATIDKQNLTSIIDFLCTTDT